MPLIIIMMKRNYHLCVIFITRFTDVVSNEDCGWIVKLPFVTNRKPFTTKSVDRMCEYLYNWVFKSESARVYPYIMIQPCLSNKREYKVITIPSQDIIYIASAKGTGHAYSLAPHERILNIAKETVQYFKTSCPHAITHQLFRVDILQTRDNKLVVNEVESIDANFVPNFGRSFHAKPHHSNIKLNRSWKPFGGISFSRLRSSESALRRLNWVIKSNKL
jgi:hypothetical protein